MGLEQTELQPRKTSRVKYRLISLGVGALVMLSGCGVLEDPNIGRGQKQPEPTPDLRPTQGPPVLAVDRGRHIYDVRSAELITVCLGADNWELINIGGRDRGGMVGRVFAAGYGSSDKEDYSLGGFQDAFERAQCSEVARSRG